MSQICLIQLYKIYDKRYYIMILCYINVCIFFFFLNNIYTIIHLRNITFSSFHLKWSKRYYYKFQIQISKWKCEKFYIQFSQQSSCQEYKLEKVIIAFIIVENMKSESVFTNPNMSLEQNGNRELSTLTKPFSKSIGAFYTSYNTDSIYLSPLLSHVRNIKCF